MPIVGLEPTQFLYESYYWHLFSSLGYIKKYAIVGLEPT
jgi:hypothetical protein